MLKKPVKFVDRLVQSMSHLISERHIPILLKGLKKNFLFLMSRLEKNLTKGEL